MTSPDKDFGPIRTDYAFFEEHSTEAEEDLAGYRRILDALGRTGGSGPLRVLDFGCGPGGFTARALGMIAWPGAVDLSIVEPQALYREQAARELPRITGRPVEAFERRSPEGRCYDLVLSNHVLYYVNDLEQAAGWLVDAVAPGGLLMTSLAGANNLLIQFWIQAFGLLGQPVPYHTSEQLAEAFAGRGIEPQRHEVEYRLEFLDTAENRASILRFLLGDHFERLPREQLLAFFDPHAVDGRIDTRIQHDHYAWVRPS